MGGNTEFLKRRKLLSNHPTGCLYLSLPEFKPRREPKGHEVELEGMKRNDGIRKGREGDSRMWIQLTRRWMSRLSGIIWMLCRTLIEQLFDAGIISDISPYPIPVTANESVIVCLGNRPHVVQNNCDESFCLF